MANTYYKILQNRMNYDIDDKKIAILHQNLCNNRADFDDNLYSIFTDGDTSITDKEGTNINIF